MQVGRTLNFDQREELVDFHAGLLLGLVIEEVGHDGRVVLDVFT